MRCACQGGNINYCTQSSLKLYSGHNHVLGRHTNQANGHDHARTSVHARTHALVHAQAQAHAYAHILRTMSLTNQTLESSTQTRSLTYTLSRTRTRLHLYRCTIIERKAISRELTFLSPQLPCLYKNHIVEVWEKSGLSLKQSHIPEFPGQKDSHPRLHSCHACP